jgi:NADH:ubiquinone oxidoreductase subunit F (NADH-binding)
MVATEDPRARALIAPTGLPRVLPRVPLTTLRDHVAHYGPRPRARKGLIEEIERAGLRGHGGAGFPTATKMAAVARRHGRKYVVVNATEGEPMSSKDKALFALAPHLVLDGAALAAEAVGASEVIVCIDRAETSSLQYAAHALGERRDAHVDRSSFALQPPPNRYVAGEESALVHWLNGGEAKPTFVPPRPFERGVARRPTLVQNAETLAHLALVARFGAQWFRALGTDSDPGSALVTISGAVARPGVYEVPLGIPLQTMLTVAGGGLEDCQAILIGGYFGSWIRSADAGSLTLDSVSLRAAGASFGCGVVVALPHDACGLVETAAVARWYAAESAGQCGPCVNGLPAIADALLAVASGDRDPNHLVNLRRWGSMVQGRGACRLPDGAARFVSSAVNAFVDDVDRHRHGHVCANPKRVLATPVPGGWR